MKDFLNSNHWFFASKNLFNTSIFLVTLGGANLTKESPDPRTDFPEAKIASFTNSRYGGWLGAAFGLLALAGIRVKKITCSKNDNLNSP